MLAVTLLSSSIDGVEGLSLFGINLQVTTYANSFIPILLGVWSMGIIIGGLKKYCLKHYTIFSPSIIFNNNFISYINYIWAYWYVDW